MRFSEFVSWCNERASDGCWGMIEALSCMNIVKEVRKEKFWRREKVWKDKYEMDVVNQIVQPINHMILERRINEN